MAAITGPRLQIQGERQSGQDVRTQNVTAVTAVANIVKTSLGPVGLDKVPADPLIRPAGRPGQRRDACAAPCRCWWTRWAM